MNQENPNVHDYKINNPNNEQQNEGENTINISQIINKYFLRYWYLYIYTLSIALVSAYFYNWYADKVYFSSCTVLIKDEKKNVNSSDLLTQLGAFNNEGGIENEIGIIRSRMLISKTIEDLQLYKSYYLIGDLKTSEVFALKPFELKEDTLYSLAYNATIKLEILSSNKYKLSFENGNIVHIG
jgi:uncharacterized protein involved in exopolysaccharide biosynthesis